MSAVNGDEVGVVKFEEALPGAAEKQVVPAYSNNRPAIFKSIPQEILAVIGLCIAPGANSMGTGSLQLALPAIGREFQITGGQLSWVLTAFL